MTRTKEIGNRGEAIAREYLKKTGHKIVAANCRVRRLEIDLIAAHGRQLIFLEVKTRFKSESDKDDIPLSGRQVKNLKRAIVAYCLDKKIRPERIRFDLIAIFVNRSTGMASLRHYRDIF